MMRFLFFLVVPFLLIACSKDKPAPVAPAGKAQATLAAPPAPTNLRFEAVTDSSCRVLWDAVEGATDYDVNYKPAVGGRWTNQPHRGVRLHNTIDDLAPNTEYRWAVRAENSDGASAWVHGPNFTTRPSQGDDSSDVSPAPTNLRLENLTDTSVRFVWDAVEGATDYDVNYKEIDGKWTNIPHRGTATYRDFDGLEPGKEYRWAVKADRGSEKSKWAFGPKFTTSPVEDEEESTEPVGEFNIELVYLDGPRYPFTTEEKRLIHKAATFWEGIISGDVPDYTLTEEDREKLALDIGPPEWNEGAIGYSTAFETPGHIDDLRIYVYRMDTNYNYIPPCNGLNLRSHGLPIGTIKVNYALNEYGYFGSSSFRRSPDILWTEDRFLWQTAHEIGHAILGHPVEEEPFMYYREETKTRVKRDRRMQLIAIYYIGQHALKAYEVITGVSPPKGIDLQLWFNGMGPPGASGYTLEQMIWYYSPARFHWPFHQALENSLMAYRTPQDMPLDAPLEISQVTRGALIDLGYQVEGMSIP